MSDQPKTLSEILAEMRKRVIGEDGIRYMLSADEVLSFLNSIEVAIKRERDSGSAAVMRAALVEILDRTNREKARDYDAALNGGILEIHDIANTALNETKGE